MRHSSIFHTNARLGESYKGWWCILRASPHPLEARVARVNSPTLAATYVVPNFIAVGTTGILYGI